MLPPFQEILFTRQRHEAKKAGLHYDIRFVVGDKAYSFATKKDIPEPGASILLYEQPVHDATYALSQRVEIPDGQYGAGVTTLDFVHKARVGENSTPTQMTIYSPKGKFLLKKMDEDKYGKKSWLFKNLGESNKYLDKVAEDLYQKFSPDLTTEQMRALGVPIQDNKYLDKAAMLITQYECPKTKAKKWIPENKPVPHGYLKTGKKTYKRKVVK